MRFPQCVPAIAYRIAEWRAVWIAKLLLILFSVALLWGESALLGGRAVTAVALLAGLVGFLCLVVVRLVQKAVVARYAPFGVNSAATPRLPLWLAVLFVAAAVNLATGLARQLLFASRLSPLYSYLVELYAHRPASEVERLDEWVFLWRFQRTRYTVLRGTGWAVDVGGFRLEIVDHSDGTTAVAVHDHH